jgi:hypothetical protein
LLTLLGEAKDQDAVVALDANIFVRDPVEDGLTRALRLGHEGARG